MEQHIREYRNGRDLTATPRDVLVIDLYGLEADVLRYRFPAVYQRVLERVKPERDAKGSTKDGAGYAKLWWLHGKPRPEMRRQLFGLSRYIATVETSKHRHFQFLDADVLPDNMLVAIAIADAFHLGVLSSAVHVQWALAAGGRLGVGNDPRYNKSRCFEPFPFPATESGLTPELTERIRSLAEQIDAHRKARQAQYSDATLTAMYNVLEKLRTGKPLTTKERSVHERGLVGVLASLHDELDAAVLAAYGWADLRLPADTDILLERLVGLNAKRSSEESAGTVRWLRPDFQQGQGVQASIGAVDEAMDADQPTAVPIETLPVRPWPSGLTEQIKAVADVTAQVGCSLDIDELAAHFSARGRWRDRLPTILDTLVTLGRLRVVPDGRWVDSGR